MITSEINDLIKISLIGHPAVGKTTIMKLLSQSQIDRTYLPTQGLDLKTLRTKDFALKIWDYGGQSGYLKTLLKDTLMGTDLILIVTDSTPRNVLNSRTLIDIANESVEEDCKIIAIANKQDLCESDGRMAPNRVENVLQVKTYGLIAIDPIERVKLLNILNQELKQVLIRKRLKEIEL